MRWSDERYVRVYTRDSANWLSWPWRARALLPLLLRKVDRAGLLKLPSGRPVAALAAVVGLAGVVTGADARWWSAAAFGAAVSPTGSAE